MFRVQEGWRVKTGRIGGTYMSGSDKGKEERKKEGFMVVRGCFFFLPMRLR